MKKHNDNFKVVVKKDYFESYIDEMMEDEFPQMMGVMSALIGSATKLTEICVSAEIQSGKKIMSEQVRKIFQENFTMNSSSLGHHDR